MTDFANCPVLALTQALISRRSITPEDAGCQQLIGDRLQQAGFHIHHQRFADTDNLFATFGSGSPHICLLGHTDVVPPGDLAAWSSPPFEPTVKDGLLYGRGAADMKTSVAAMCVALERYATAGPTAATVSLLLTSDEEGPADHGIKRMVPWLADQGIAFDYCIVGEPSASQQLGDSVRIGRRGSLYGRATITGSQGHTAYPRLSCNPIHAAAQSIANLTATVWDEGNDAFPATTLAISSVRADGGAGNVTPAQLILDFNFRFCPESNAQSLIDRTQALFAELQADVSFDWRLSGEPFMTASEQLQQATRQVIHRHCGIEPDLNTGGGTSDGRFVAPTGAQVVEIGPVNASIHKTDEHVRLTDLPVLADIYYDLLLELSRG